MTGTLIRRSGPAAPRPAGAPGPASHVRTGHRPTPLVLSQATTRPDHQEIP